jgi:membrane protein YdbS with pleckstrin-like domain
MDTPQGVAPPVDPARVHSITGPARALLALYVIRAAFASMFTLFVAFPIVITPLFVKYWTLRYRFEEDAVVFNWGLLFRRETIVPYGRIQDIHLVRSWLERWFGIGTVEIQTASSTRGAAESLVGLKDDEAVRDFLYSRMRGTESVPHALPAPPSAPTDDPKVLLGAIRDELRAATGAVSGAR